MEKLDFKDKNLELEYKKRIKEEIEENFLRGIMVIFWIYL
jgi:hypothetical protein